MKHEIEEKKSSTFSSGWYRIESSAKIKKGKIYTFNYFSTSFICFRDSTGTINMFNAYCPHLGAHIGIGGKLYNDQVICPFHGWKYDSMGTCVEIPYCKTIPKRAKLTRYQVEEIHSSIYMYFEPIHLFSFQDDTLTEKKDKALMEFTHAKTFLSIRMDINKFQKLIAFTKTILHFKQNGPGIYITETKSKRNVNFILTATPIDNQLLAITFACAFNKVLNPLYVFNIKKEVHKQFKLLLKEVDIS